MWLVIFHCLLVFSVSALCRGNKRLTKYKPGHIPEFENPDNEEADTYYGINSDRLFPERRHKEGQLKTDETQLDSLLSIQATQMSGQMIKAI